MKALLLTFIILPAVGKTVTLSPDSKEWFGTLRGLSLAPGLSNLRSRL